MVVYFLRWSPIAVSHTIQVKLSLRTYKQTTKKQQHSLVLLFSQECEWPVARKTRVCSTSLIILNHSLLWSDRSNVSLALQVNFFVCRTVTSDAIPSAFLRKRPSSSISAHYCYRSAESAGGELEKPLPCWAYQNLSAGSNSQERRDKQHK